MVAMIVLILAPCCDFLTMDGPDRDTYVICPVCGWEDDPVQYNDPDREGGANTVSLNQAGVNYETFEAAKKRSLSHIRPPLSEEIPFFRGNSKADIKIPVYCWKWCN